MAPYLTMLGVLLKWLSYLTKSDKELMFLMLLEIRLQLSVKDLQLDQQLWLDLLFMEPFFIEFTPSKKLHLEV